jgi:hypothetical protein
VIHDVLRDCPHCKAAWRRLEIVNAGPHSLWVVECDCARLLIIAVTDGSPIDWGLAA